MNQEFTNCPFVDKVQLNADIFAKKQYAMIANNK